MAGNVRTISQDPQSHRLGADSSTNNKTKIDLGHEEEKIANDPDFQIDLSQSDNERLDGNLNTLMALVRLAVAKIQHTQRTREKADLKEKEDNVRDKIKASKNTTLHEARILFAQAIFALTTSIPPILPELADMKDLFKGISETSQLISSTLTKGCDANLKELDNEISLVHQHIQKLNSKEPSQLRTVDESFSRMASDLRVGG